MKKNKPLVKFFRNQTFFHQDVRRHIIGLAGNLKFGEKLKQMKIINVKSKLLKKKIIGNHRHKFASKQWEYIYVLHEDLKKNIFEFRYKNYDGPVKKKLVKSGDCIIVPPGCSLGLLPLVNNSFIIEISNKIYHDNYEKVDLFKD